MERTWCYSTTVLHETENIFFPAKFALKTSVNFGGAVFLKMHCNSKNNKKVLLLERKRHTARRVASTPNVILTGYPPGRVPSQQGTPPAGYPLAGYPPSRVPPQQGTPLSPAGYPPSRVPPQQGSPFPGCPMAFWEILQSIMGYRYPPPVDRQMEGQTRVKTLPSRRTTYAGGNKLI